MTIFVTAAQHANVASETACRICYPSLAGLRSADGPASVPGHCRADDILLRNHALSVDMRNRSRICARLAWLAGVAGGNCGGVSVALRVSRQAGRRSSAEA